MYVFKSSLISCIVVQYLTVVSLGEQRVYIYVFEECYKAVFVQSCSSSFKSYVSLKT